MSQQYRVVLLGDPFVGKTALIGRFIENERPANYNETIGAAFHTFTQKINDKSVTLQIWDTAGHEKYRALGPVYYRNACAGILVYDVTNRRSFENLPQWVQSFRESVNQNVPLFIVGNKVDLEDELQVDVAQGQQFAQESNFRFFSTSALTGFNVNFLFQKVAEEVLENTSHCKVDDPKVTDLNSTNEEGTKGCC